MLPYTPRKDYLSFTDKKWDWRYQIDQDGFVKDKNPRFSELQPSGDIKEYICEIKES